VRLREFTEWFVTVRFVFCSQDLMEEVLSEPDGSFSSRVSNKSDKNELDAEESTCDDELDLFTTREWVCCIF